MAATEYVVLVNEQDQEMGIAEKLAAHEQCLLHRAFSVFLFRKTNSLELLLQQRALDKYHSAGLWTNTCCSHPRVGEDILLAGQRRLHEELGITADLTHCGWFHYQAHFPNQLSENEIDHVLVGVVAHDLTPLPNPKEVHAYRWISVTDLQAELAAHPEQFTPWLQEALQLAIQHV